MDGDTSVDAKEEKDPLAEAAEPMDVDESSKPVNAAPQPEASSDTPTGTVQAAARESTASGSGEAAAVSGEGTDGVRDAAEPESTASGSGEAAEPETAASGSGEAAAVSGESRSAAVSSTDEAGVETGMANAVAVSTLALAVDDKSSGPASNGIHQDVKEAIAAGKAPVKDEFLVSHKTRGERIRIEAVRSGAQQNGESSKEVTGKLSKRQQKKQRREQAEAAREKRKLEGPAAKPTGLVDELNFPRGDLLVRLRRRDYAFPVSDVVLEEMGVKKQHKNRETAQPPKEAEPKPLEDRPEQDDRPEEAADADSATAAADEAAADSAAPDAAADEAEDPPAKRSKVDAADPRVGAIVERERKKLDFRGKTILAPLTTVGNLPFRRLCKKLGADVTVSEMAMATKLLQGHNAEWALVRRHKDEDIFGVQLAGGYSDALASCAECISKECDVDFIDINCGCPIDLVCNKGAGSSLLRKPRHLETAARAIVRSVNVPVTLKLRMGFEDGNPVAHTIVPKLADWGITAVTLHGRSREQRYSKAANWEYIWDCSRTSSIPLIGNGDVCDFEDQVRAYQGNPEGGGVAGIMIARGALYKPWVFTEIKNQKRWDISSSERFDLLKDYVKFGLEHWGADPRGVETTRRFLLEWLSYTCRYIPVGLLEVNPQRLQWRTPSYRGRDDLETLMASESPLDWVKLSEMLLGPAGDGFTFQPKHKSSAHSKEAEVEG